MQFFNWLLKNISNIFSVIGIFLTIYLGFFYAPSWMEEMKNEKLRNAESEIQKSVKELVYSDSIFKITEIEALVKAKELSLHIKYPHSINDILTQTQESFMEDKFLPLNKRKELMTEIEKAKLPLTNSNAKVQKAEEDKSWLNLSTFFIMAISVILSILGIVGSFLKFKTEKDKQDEIDNSIQDITIEYNYNGNGYEFEKDIIEILSNDKTIQNLTKTENDYGVDAFFDANNKKYFVEIKYLNRSKVGLNTIHRIINSIRGKEGIVWLIYNTQLTGLVASEIIKFNRESNIKIKPIKVTSPEEFKSRLPELLKT
ncbi:restriction endonuclease [Flavobacterium sp. UBA7680]|uniref:restriction endonuclease n=1 Tax=Flavobacterium sp. UBA7680 TaxID=1946559 RepID=UPI0025BF7621|nr:restriction endonuclease [Flavobacterium sp. UBA7680]